MWGFFAGFRSSIQVFAAVSFLTAVASGQTYSLAYVKNGDLWVRAAGSASARQVTRSGHILSPKFSADGRFVAFEENRSKERFGMDAAVSVLDLSKPDPVQLPVPGGYESYLWSPMDDTLAVSNEQGVYLFRARNSWAAEKIVAVDDSHTSIVDVISEPDGQGLLASLRKHTSSEENDQGLIDFVATGGQHRVTPLVAEDSKGIEFDGFTPDGQTLLLWEDQDFSQSIKNDGLQLYAMSMRNHEIRPVSGANTMVFQDQVSLSPDGRSLLTPAIFQDPWFMGRETWASRPLARIDLASGWKAVINGPYTSTLSPSWSPDGKNLAYVQAPTGRDNIGKRRIWIANPTGVEKRKLTNDKLYRDENPVWLSNDTLLFSRVDSASRASLWSIGRNGGNLTRLASLGTLPDEAMGYYGHVTWGDYFDVWMPKRASIKPVQMEAGAAQR